MAELGSDLTGQELPDERTAELATDIMHRSGLRLTRAEATDQAVAAERFVGDVVSRLAELKEADGSQEQSPQ
ncbi:MAG TPA: hypothetical protein VMR28_00670 [Candidatus Saccharimonadales bacterium]|nr:hypothetical protein [Candidatus Saccharimonadales bacterium]